MQRRQFMRGATGLSLAGCALAPGAAFAQNWPDRPVRIIVSAPPGGGSDVVGRLLAEGFSTSLGQRFVVENRVGAGGTIAAEAAARAAPDGNTLFIGIVSTQVIVPAIRRVPYDAENGFAPIGLISMAPMVLIANPNLPARSVAELVALSLSRPGGLPMSNGGMGTLPHLLHEMFARHSGLVSQAISYSGSATALQAVVSGEAAASFEVGVIVRGQALAGAVRPLAVTTAERDPGLPEVPTMIEAGFPQITASSWTGLFAPAGTPRPIIALLNERMNAIIATPEFQTQMARLGARTMPGSPEDLAGFLVQERGRWTELARSVAASLN